MFFSFDQEQRRLVPLAEGASWVTRLIDSGRPAANSASAEGVNKLTLSRAAIMAELRVKGGSPQRQPRPNGICKCQFADGPN